MTCGRCRVSTTVFCSNCVARLRYAHALRALRERFNHRDPPVQQLPRKTKRGALDDVFREMSWRITFGGLKKDD